VSRRRRLAYVAIATGILVVTLLFVALNRGPLARGFRPYERGESLRDYCFWCDDSRPMAATDILGIVLIGLVVLMIPAGHIAALIMLAIHATRPPKFSDLEPAYRCPACNHPLVRPWRVCPYCGTPIASHAHVHDSEEASHVDSH